MAKRSGLRQGLLVDGYDVSGDVGSIDTLSTARATFEVTGLDKAAFERILGVIDANLEFTCWFNPASGASHEQFSSLPTENVGCMYLLGREEGDPCFILDGRQVNYDWTRAADGALTGKVQVVGDHRSTSPVGYWSNLLTEGIQVARPPGPHDFPDASGVEISAGQGDASGFSLSRSYELVQANLANNEVQFTTGGSGPRIYLPIGGDATNLANINTGWNVTITGTGLTTDTLRITGVNDVPGSPVSMKEIRLSGDPPTGATAGLAVTLQFSPPSRGADLTIHVVSILGIGTSLNLQLKSGSGNGTFTNVPSGGITGITATGKRSLRIPSIGSNRHFQLEVGGNIPTGGLAHIAAALRIDSA